MRRDRVMRPPCAVVSFGFGGKMVVMIPKQKARPAGRGMSPGKGKSAGEPENGRVRVLPMLALLENDSEIDKLCSFPGPLTGTTRKGVIIKVLASLLSLCMPA